MKTARSGESSQTTRRVAARRVAVSSMCTGSVSEVCMCVCVDRYFNVSVCMCVFCMLCLKSWLTALHAVQDHDVLCTTPSASKQNRSTLPPIGMHTHIQTQTHST